MIIKRVLTILFILIFVFLASFSSLSTQPDVNAQIILPTFTFIFATPTRTPTPINVGNFVWDDLDQDGRQDAGEPGLANITAQLWNGAKTQLIDSTVTNSNGNYTLIAPTPGDYRVRVVLPSGSDSFSPKDLAGGDDLLDSDIFTSGADLGFTHVYTFASNLISITTIDAGIIVFRTPTPTRTPTPVNIGNFVWDDLDQDGRQDAGEPGIPGVTVQLWNTAKTQLLYSTITNATGNYFVIAPTPGDYRVRVVLPNANDGFSPKDLAAGDNALDSDINPSGPDIGFTDIFNIASNVISTTLYDAGIIVFRTATPTRTQTPVNIGNFVWDDLDQDGRQDAGEPGLPGVTVQLWNTAKSQLLYSTITNATGNYFVIAPTPGDYRIRVVLPNMSDSFSPKNQAGGDDTLDSDINPTGIDIGFTDIFNIASNVISTTLYDAGIIVYRTPTPTRTQTPISLGNFVWHDLNGNGIQDAGEPGIGGITVQLWNNEKSFMFDSTITNPNGNYFVIAPTPGDYRIRVIRPAGSTFSPTDQGGNDGQDSDIISNFLLPNYGFTTTISIASNVISISNLDAGLMNVSPSPTPTLTPTRTPIPDDWSEVFLPLLMR